MPARAHQPRSGRSRRCRGRTRRHHPRASAAALDALVDAGLIRRRYSLPDLDDARRTNDETDTNQERHAALGRLVDEYLRVVSAAQLAINPRRWSLGRYLQQPPVMHLDPADAVALLDSELDTIAELQLLATELGLHREARELAEALAGLFNRVSITRPPCSCTSAVWPPPRS